MIRFAHPPPPGRQRSGPSSTAGSRTVPKTSTQGSPGLKRNPFRLQDLSPADEAAIARVRRHGMTRFKKSGSPDGFESAGHRVPRDLALALIEASQVVAVSGGALFPDLDPQNYEYVGGAR